MHPVRDFFAGVTENWSQGINHVFQGMGILPDGRELVNITEDDRGKLVTFPDRTPEGWPGFTIHLPKEACFDKAHNTILGRRAFWLLPKPSEAVVRHLIEHNPGFPPPAEELRRETTYSYRGEPRQPITSVGFRLDDGVEVTVMGVRPESSHLGVRQRRGPDALEEAMRARVKSLSEAWGVYKPEP